MRTRFAATLALLLVVIPSYAQEMSRIDRLRVDGQVRAIANPVENALVIAFGLTDSLTLRTSTGHEGRFSLPPLPIGVYRLVAVKRGFLPASATVMPVKEAHSVVFDLKSQEESTQAERADAWSIRRSLPKDVLRDVEAILGSMDQQDEPGSGAMQFAGSLESLTGYSGNDPRRDLERSTLSLASEMGNWGVELRGRRQLVQQGDWESSQAPAEAADVLLEVHSSPTSTYRITSTRASWTEPSGTGRQADVQTHTVGWRGGRSSVQLRYASRENLFPVDAQDASFELSGSALVYRGARNDLGVSVRLRQDHRIDADDVETESIRYADVGTTGRLAVTDRVGLDYGVVTRVGVDLLEVMPQTAANIRLGRFVELQVAGAYKIESSRAPERVAAELASFGRVSGLDTRYRYSVAVSSDFGERSELTASAGRAAADTFTFMLFDDRFDEFWDGLYLREGDVLTNGALSLQTGIGRSVEISVVTAGGLVEPSEGVARKQFVSGELRTRYEPTDTTLDVAYRLLAQPTLMDESLLREIERLSVVIGQSLHLPVDVRVLVGVTLADEAPSLVASGDSDRSYRRLVGGLSFSF